MLPCYHRWCFMQSISCYEWLRFLLNFEYEMWTQASHILLHWYLMIENGIMNQLNIVWIIIMSCYISTYHVKSLLICCWNVVKQELVLRPTLWSFFLVEIESVALPSVFLVEKESVVSLEAEQRAFWTQMKLFYHFLHEILGSLICLLLFYLLSLTFILAAFMFGMILENRKSNKHWLSIKLN